MRELDLSALEFVNAHAGEAKLRKEREERRHKREERRRKQRIRNMAYTMAIISLFSTGICVFAQDFSAKETNVSTETTSKVIVKNKEIIIEDVETEEIVDEILEDEEEIIGDDVIENNFTYESITISDSDKELFERIVMAECYSYFTEDEMLIIASVIRNRVESENFPNTVREVLTEEIQFETYTNGRYLTVTPNENCKKAVERALAGDTNIQTTAEYFCTTEYYEVESGYMEKYQFFHSLNHHFTFRNVMVFGE